MIIGFTGTQAGMSKSQKDNFETIMTEISIFHPDFEFHHGDCIGADQEAHDIVSELTKNIIIHPPSNSSKRAFCKAKTMLESKPYLERNKDIVNVCEALIACPKGSEILRSGTWSTIRYAKKINKIVYIINA